MCRGVRHDLDRVILFAFQLRQQVLRRDRGPAGPRHPPPAVDRRFGSMRRPSSGSPAARACPHPRVQEEGNGLRNPRVAGYPATHRPFVHTQALGSLHLAQAQAAEGIAELLRRHGHNALGKVPVARSQGKWPQPTWGCVLSNRAICPRLSTRCLVISQTRQRGTSAGRSGSWRSSRVSCAIPRRASWGATITSVWLWPHAVGCGSLRRRFERPSVLGTGCFDSSCSSEGWSLKGWSSSASAPRSWRDCARDSCEASCDLSSHCERSSCLAERIQEVGRGVREIAWLFRRESP